MFFILRSPTPGELLVAWKNYKASDPEEINLQEGDIVELLDTADPAGPTVKRRKLNPELDIEGEKPLDTTAAQHRLSVRPRRTHTSSRHSPTRTNLNARWLVRKVQGDKRKGWVPCQVLQSVDEPTPSSGLPGDAAFRRQAVVNELVETEQEFVKDLDYVVQNYLINPERDPKKVPKVVRDNFSDVFMNLKEIAEFHRVVLMEGVKYYANEPALLGKAFLRLERDFDKHVSYYKEEPIAQALLDASSQARDYFEELSHRLGDDKTLSEHLKLPIQRINDYQLLVKELVRYSACLGEDNSDLQKALELMLSVPHRAQDDKFTSSIEGYRGSIHKLGRLLAHDWFSIHFGEFVKERYLFLFKARILICKVRRISDDRSVFQLKDIIRLPQVDVKDRVGENTFELIEKATGQVLILTTHRENVKEFWLKEIREFAGEADESVSDDLQVTSEPTSPPTEPEQFEKEVQRPTQKLEDIPIPVPKLEALSPKVEEPVPKAPKPEVSQIKVPKAEESPKENKEVKEKFVPVVEQVLPPVVVALVEKVPAAVLPKTEEPPAKIPKVEESVRVPKLEEVPVKVQKQEEPLKSIAKVEEKSQAQEVPKAKEAEPKQITKLEEKPKEVAKPVEEAKPQTNPKLAGNPKPIVPKTEKPEIQESTVTAASRTAQQVEVKSESSSSSFVAQKTQSVTVQKQSTTEVSVVSKEEKVIASESREPDHYKIGLQVGLKPESGFDVDDDMSRKYTEYTSSASARSGGGYEDSSYSRRSSAKSSYSGDGYSSSKYSTGELAGGRRSTESSATSKYTSADSISSKYGTDSLSGKYGADTAISKYSTDLPTSKYGTDALTSKHATDTLTSKYGTDTLSSKYGTDALTSKYGTDALTSKHSTDTLTSKYGTDALSSKYGTDALTSKYGTDALTSKYGSDSLSSKYSSDALTSKYASDPLGNKYGVETTKYGTEGNTKYEITSRYNKSDIDGGSKTEMSVTKRSVTDTGDGDAYGVYTKRSIRTESKMDDDGDYDYKRSRHKKSITGIIGDGDSYSSYTRRSTRDTRVEDEGDYDVRPSRRLKLRPGDDAEEYSYKKSFRSTEKSIAGDGDGEHIYRKSSRTIERIGDDDLGYTYKKKTSVLDDDSTDRYISRRKPRKIEDDDFDIDEYVMKEKSLNEDLDPSAYLSKRRSLKNEEGEDSLTQIRTTVRQDSDKGDYKRLTSVEEENKYSKSEKYSKKFSREEEDKSAKIETHQNLSTETRKRLVSSEDEEKSIKIEMHQDLSKEARKRSVSSEDEDKSAKIEKHQDLSIAAGRRLVFSEDEDISAKIEKHQDLSTETHKRLVSSEDEEKFIKIEMHQDLSKEARKRSVSSEDEDISAKIEKHQDLSTETRKRIVSSEDEDVKFEKYSEIEDKRESSSVKEPSLDKPDIEFMKTVTETAHMDSESIALSMKAKKDITSPPDERPLFTKTLSGQTVEPTEEELNKPHFAVQLKDTALLEDTYLRFMVKVKGDPHPDVKFYKNGVKISESDQRTRVIKDHENIGFYELVIPDVKRSDAGLYKCVAVNSYGESSTEANLTVTESKQVFDDGIDREGILPPGEKPDFSWRKDGKEFDPEERFKVLMGDDEDSLALIFQHVRPEDAGLYTCVAQTTTGHISCSAELTVQGTVVELHREPEKPQLIIEHREAIATVGGQAMLELQIKGFPKPKVKLTKEGQNIEPSNKFKFLYEDEENLSIVIKNVEASDAGKYEFSAENELGQDIREVTLSVRSPPKIKSKIEDISVEVEHTLRIPVEVEGIPIPTVKFYKDGKEIKPSDRIKIVEEGATLTLVIEKTILKDSGSYSIVASNEVSQVSEFCNVNVFSKPKILKKLGTDIIVSQSEEVELSIKLQSEPAPEVTWFKDGKEITSDSHYVIRNDGDTYILKITGAVTTDSSSYKCRAKNIYGSVDDDCKVYVRCAPRIVKALEDMTVAEFDKNITFDVKVEAFPKPSVKWYLDEMEISETRTEFTRIESDDGVKLVIKEVTSELSGKYSCKLNNELGAVETSAKLTVNCKPRIIKQLKDTTVEEGATLHLEVEVEGTPEPTVKWLRNGNEVSADARIKITRDIHRQESYSLTVNLIKYEEEGEYEVEVTNMLGTVNSKSFVTVQTLPVITDSTMKDKSQYESLDVLYTVRGTANPPPTAIWTVNGKPITSSTPRCSISQIGEEFKLEVKKLKMEDAGEYKCVLKNPVGEASAQAKLDIIPEKEFRKPKIKEGLQDQTIQKKNTIVLKAVVIGDPVPDATWCFNGKPISEDEFEKYKVILETEDRELDDNLKECTYTMTIPRCDRDNEGKYTIKAKNKWGEAESSAYLTILLKPEIKGPDDVKVVPGNSTELKAVIQANPVPTIIWTRNENVVESTEDLEIIADVQAETYILRFKNVKLSDEGYYKVTAKNNLGEDSSEARVRVLKEPEPTTEKPKFITGLTDAQIEHGGEITLMVRADGLPRPELTWFLNNKPIKDAPELKTVANTESQVTSYLTIIDFNDKDSGYYRATAVNVVGDAETSAKIAMIQTPPAFTLRLIRNMDINEDEPLILKAKITGSPKPILKWYKDGELIPTDDDRVKTEVSPDGNIKLQIDAVKPSDSGAYKLVVTNPNGETAGLCAVAVTPTPQRPKFTKCLKDQKLTIGEPLRLEAYVSGYPPPEIKWFKDGLPIRPSSNIHIEHHPDGRIALVIDAVKAENAGKYSVVATNKHGDLTGEAKVETERRPSRPDFATRLFPQNVVEGFPVKMEVKVTGFPLPKVAWFRNDAEVIPDPQHIKITNLPDGTSILVIDACSINADALTYKAVAMNEAGSAESSAQLTVSPAAKQNQPEERPMFLHPLKDVITDEGQELKIEVPFTGNPIPSVEWFKDGVPIRPSDRILLTCDGRKVGLLIDKAIPSDAGQYSVKIVNPLGTDTTEAKAIVHKVFAPPKFTQRFTDLQQLPSRDAKFLARVSGVPQPSIAWYKDGQLLHETDKYRIKRDGDVCCLYVNNSDEADQGVYKAVATNKEGEDICEARLAVVKEIKTPQKVEAPYFLKRLGDTELFKAMTAKFTACAAGTPEPDVMWYHNDEKMYPSERIRMEKDTNGLLRLTIAGIDQDDLGTYSCKIFNDYGQDICHAELRFDETEAKSKRPIVDQYIDYDKFKKSGSPVPLSDAPIISRMTDRRCTLSWKPSISPTPRTPVTYQLEMLEMPHGDWFTVRSGIRGCVCDVGNLEPFRDYKFRIRVENKYGISDPSPHATTHRQKLEPDLPKWVPYLSPGIDFRPETSPYFPKDFDIDRPPHDGMAQAPRFLRREDDTSYGIKDQNTNLFWFVYGYPKPKMTFYFNDQPVESGGRFSTSYTRNGQATLFINKMLDRDVGWYEAVASNEHGEARQRVRLEIAEIPIFLKRPDIEYVMVRGKARFEARVIGVPYPDIKWYRDWKPLATSSRTKIAFIEPDTHVLTINDSILKDEGLYSISARNVAGSVSSSAMLHIEENDLEFNVKTYNNLAPIRTKRTPFESGYDLGDELGRGTQGITYHAVERMNGRNYAAKVMHGRGDLRPFMYNELDMMNQLCHRKLIALRDAYETDDSLTLVMELAGGGELVKDYLLKQDYYTESEVAGYIRQLLTGLKYMHEKGIGHMGLNIGDLLLSHPGSDDLKITDFSLSRRISMGRLAPLKYGVPEYVSPECANGEGVGLGHDMWSVGIITYILLSGMSPFRGERDKETLIKIQEGKWNFDESWWKNISVEGRDFISKLLVYQAEGRMDVHSALRHPWLEKCDKIWTDEFRISSKFLRDYFVLYREWYDNASCRNWFRRRPLEGAFTHPSRMVYPPNERYTPPPTLPTPDRTPRKIPTWEDQIPSRSPLNYEIGMFKSESHYQSGPDTYLLQLRDVDFPVRIREYMKVAANRGPGAGYIVSDENGFDWRTPVIRERRRFTDVMDEEIDDERKARITKYGTGSSGYNIRRIRHEIGSRLDAYAEAEAFMESKHEGRLPFFREKPQMEALQEGKDLELTCFAVGDPTPIVQWFKNDAIIAESHRIKIETDSEGRSHIKFTPALSFDVGLYKVVARNKIGQTVVRTRIVVGLVPDEPDSPEATQTSSTEALLTWKQPKFDGHAPVQCYSLQYKKANDTEWTEQANNIDHEFYLMTGLEPSESYVFRLCAKNSIGWSEPGVASMVVITKPTGTPKIQLTKAMAHLQQITDSGQEPQACLNARPNYNLEVDPIDWTNENAQNKYEFISEISRGRFSTVLKAIDKSNDSLVIAKLIEQGENKEQVDGEFAALRSLRHERIAGIIAAYRTADSPVATFILEKLQGADVLTYLASRHDYTEQTVATIVTQVLDGLQYLHWRGLCHLDLQPDNIVMSGVRSVQVKLVDFGCAHRVTKLGNRVPVVGHPDYMAPEVLAEEPAFPLTDIWSLGVLMYVMLSGTLPFRGEDETESRQNILFVRYRFENLFQEVTQEGVRFLMLVFKRHPNKRPTAEECHENRWLLPTDFMIKKRERAVFLGNRLKEYNEQYHKEKLEAASSNLAKGMMRSHSITEELLTAP